jgi:signal transduction histidine kinase
MDHFQKLTRQVRRHLFLILVASNILIIGVGALLYALNLPASIILPVIVSLSLATAGVSAYVSSNFVLQPLKMIWQAIIYVSPEHNGVSPPDPQQAVIGRELVTSLIMQVYQYASQQDDKSLVEHRQNISQAANIVNHLPLPLFVFNKELLVTNASASALDYCQVQSANLFGKPLFDNLDLEFANESTLEKWITECQQTKVTDTATWERVRVRIKDQATVKQCDLAAYYNRDNPSGTEFIVTLFDRTERYTNEDKDLGFVALAVHELRTPLTMLRGYIEVFEDELTGKLDPEMQDFVHKMSVSSQQLAVFINNILNVARIESNQLSLHLKEEKWEEVLQQICDDLQMRATINDKILEIQIPASLPTVAADRVSMYEVVTNLVENAIKYGGESKKIIINTTLRKDGLVETTVQDFGVGIPKSVLPNLFEKFYRNHRTRAQIGGSGLGLFLCKAIVGAHSGNIWASSEEGKGSTFGFTLLPYTQLSEEMKSGSADITRTAHGWIKNHSLYRR